jgi:hypothetical protein
MDKTSIRIPSHPVLFAPSGPSVQDRSLAPTRAASGPTSHRYSTFRTLDQHRSFQPCYTKGRTSNPSSRSQIPSEAGCLFCQNSYQGPCKVCPETIACRGSHETAAYRSVFDVPQTSCSTSSKGVARAQVGLYVRQAVSRRCRPRRGCPCKDSLSRWPSCGAAQFCHSSGAPKDPHFSLGIWSVRTNRRIPCARSRFAADANTEKEGHVDRRRRGTAEQAHSRVQGAHCRRGRAVACSWC